MGGMSHSDGRGLKDTAQDRFLRVQYAENLSDKPEITAFEESNSMQTALHRPGEVAPPYLNVAEPCDGIITSLAEATRRHVFQK